MKTEKQLQKIRETYLNKLKELEKKITNLIKEDFLSEELFKLEKEKLEKKYMKIKIKIKLFL